MPWIERRDRSQVVYKVFEDDDGVAYPEYHGLREYSSHLNNVRAMDVRPDDVFILGYPKSGNHWMFEITTMLLHAKTEYTNLTLGDSTLDGCSTERIASMASPRVMDSHLKSHLLPQQIVDKKSKLILVLRNPKDIVVSLYSFLSTIHICSPYHGTFEDFFDLYIHGQSVYGSWMEYIQNFDQFLKDNPQHPVHIVTFESLKHDLLSEVRRLSEFLEVQLPESTLRNIADKTTFSNMSKALNSGKLEHMKKVFDEGAPGLFRKGIAGEWKNWLTIAQSEDFDTHFRQKMQHSGLASRVLPYI